jgi:hypothetical protein
MLYGFGSNGGRVTTMIGCSVNNSISITSIDTVVSIGSYVAAGTLTLGTSAAVWQGYGNIYNWGTFTITNSGGGVFQENGQHGNPSGSATTINLTSSTYTLSTTDAINAHISFAGSLSAPGTITFPNPPVDRILRYNCFNDTSQPLTLVVTGGTYSVTLAPGTFLDVAVSNGNVIAADGTLSQPSRVGQLTDLSGGTASGTLAAVPAAYSQTEIANALASLSAKVNALELIIHNAGISL